MRKIFNLFSIAVLLLTACNDGASKEAKAVAAAAKEPAIPETEMVKDNGPAKEPEPANAATTAAWKGVQEINDAVFTQKVLKNPGLTIVDFNATWCGPCKMLKPIFDKAATRFEGKASFASIDVDESPTVAEQYKVQSIPLLLFFKNGKVVKSIIGLVSDREIYAAVEKNL